jgi:hypothetical protein
MAASQEGVGAAGPNILQLFHRTRQPGVVVLQGDERDHEIAATSADAFDAGHDAVLIKNYDASGGLEGRNILVVKDPSQLRVPWAAFDPGKADSTDLLASRVPFSPVDLLNQRTDPIRDPLAYYRTGGT